MDERALVVAAQKGDGEAFAGLVRLHQARLRALVALSIPGRDEAHDLVQEAFIDAWKGLAGFDTGREFGPWLRTLCRNRLRQFLRDRLPRRRRELALVDEALLACPAAAEDDGEARLGALRTCLDALPAEHRRVLALRFVEELAVQDIASALERSPNAVSMVILRLKAALARCIGQRLGAPA